MGEIMRLFVRKIFTALSLFFSYLSKITYRSEQEKQVDLFLKSKGDMTLRLDYKLNENSIVFDMGGFVGQWASDLFAKYCCRIHIFEPVSEFADDIKKRFSANYKIIVHNFGLSDSTKQVAIKLDKEGSTVYKKGSECERTTVNLIKAEDFLKQNSVEHIDLMKINIEGGEYDLIEHLIETGFIKKITDLQVQFHNFVPEAIERMHKIQGELQETHYITYQYPFVWENWHLKER